MPIIEVAKRFVLRTDDGKSTEYLVGRYDVPDEVAEHWYVKPHLVGAAPVAPPQPYAQSQLVIEQAVRMGEPVAEQLAEPAPAPPGTVTARTEVTFAGPKVEDKSVGISWAGKAPG